MSERIHMGSKGNGIVSSQSDALAEKLAAAFWSAMDEKNAALAAMTERQRRDHMKANGMYPGPHYDASYYADPEAWWKRYEAKHPIGQDG